MGDGAGAAAARAEASDDDTGRPEGGTDDERGGGVGVDTGTARAASTRPPEVVWAVIGLPAVWMEGLVTRLTTFMVPRPAVSSSTVTATARNQVGSRP